MPPTVSSTAEERQPLLQNESAAEAGEADPQVQVAKQPKRLLLRVIIPGALILFLSQWFYVFISFSMGQLIDRAICRRQFPDVDAVRYEGCNRQSVREELFFITSWESVLVLVASLLTVVPYNVMAEKRGPKAVVLLMLAGQMLTYSAQVLVCLLPGIFNPRLVWLCATFVVVGGGPVVLNSLALYIGNSISSDEHRATVFFISLAIRMIGGTTASLVAPSLVDISSLVTTFLALGTLVIIFCLQLIMPPDAINRKPLLPQSSDAPTTLPRAIYLAFKTGATGFSDLFRSNYKIDLLLFTRVLYIPAVFAVAFRVMYPVIRFEWSLPEAQYLSFITSGVRFTMLLVVLPVISNIVIHSGRVSGARKDIWLSRVLTGVLVLGNLAVGLAPTSQLFIAAACLSELSAGSGSAIVSFLASVVTEEHKGLLFGYVAMLEAIGSLISGPLIAGLISAGLNWGSQWSGLPFIFVGILQIFVFAILFLFRDQSAEK